MKLRWSVANKKEDVFFKKNCDQLNDTFEIPKLVNRLGRPKISEMSERRTEDLRQTANSEVLTSATRVTLGFVGEKHASKIVKEISYSPNRTGK